MENKRNKEILEIGSNLESHHSLFYYFWKIGNPRFSNEINTACVKFDDKGECIDFVFNEKFYDSLTFYDKKFIICHEILHVVFEHGNRLNDKKIYPAAANVAMDVAVNHCLIKQFGFDRSKTSDIIKKDGCWVDTVFKNQQVSDNETAEKYFELMDKNTKLSTLDDHSGLESLFEGSLENIIAKIDAEMHPEEKKDLKNLLEKHLEPEENKAGNQSVGHWSFVDVNSVKKKKKWETVIRKWAIPFLLGHKDEEQWARLNRRFISFDSNMFIPSEMEENHHDLTKIKVAFFLDTSGSCWNLKDRFFKAALSLPSYRFDLSLFCFDNSVYPTTLQSRKVAGGGGTSFKIIEHYIRKNMESEYPFVFVITDGYGDLVHPQFPEKWYWFLTTNYRYYVPSNSLVFQLKDFE